MVKVNENIGNFKCEICGEVKTINEVHFQSNSGLELCNIDICNDCIKKMAKEFRLHL